MPVEVDAGPRVEDAATGILMIRISIYKRVDLLHRTDADVELVAVSTPSEPVVSVVVVAGRQRQLVELAISHDLGAPGRRRIAAAGRRPAPE